MGKITKFLIGLVLVLGLSSCGAYEGTVEVGSTPFVYYSPYTYVYRPYYHRPTPPPPVRVMRPAPQPKHNPGPTIQPKHNPGPTIQPNRQGPTRGNTGHRR